MYAYKFFMFVLPYANIFLYKEGEEKWMHCSQHFRIVEEENHNYENASCYYAVRFPGPRGKKSGLNLRVICIAYRTAQIHVQAAKLLFKSHGL